MCCHLFRCIGWLLDIIQRILTFTLASVLCCALCCGFFVCIGAGIAYGYQMSLAEFLDLKKTDVTVFVRRGQFQDRPDVRSPFRRAWDDQPDIFSSNYSVDYQEQKPAADSRPLSDAWQKAQDTSNYADKLTKYSKMNPNLMRLFPKDDDGASGDMPVEKPSEDSDPPSVKPVQFMVEHANSSNDLNMRKFLPDYRPPYSQNDNSFQAVRRTHKKYKHKKKKPDITIEVGDDQSLYLQPNASKLMYSPEDFEDGDIQTNRAVN